MYRIRLESSDCNSARGCRACKRLQQLSLFPAGGGLEGASAVPDPQSTSRTLFPGGEGIPKYGRAPQLRAASAIIDPCPTTRWSSCCPFGS